MGPLEAARRRENVDLNAETRLKRRSKSHVSLSSMSITILTAAFKATTSHVIADRRVRTRSM